jgi:hypothetical protein
MMAFISRLHLKYQDGNFETRHILENIVDFGQYALNCWQPQVFGRRPGLGGLMAPR